MSHDNKILISERGREPSKGAYDVPGGFVELNEANEQAVLREIEEELLLSSQDYSTPEYLGSYYSEYKYEKETYHILVTVFTAQLLVDPKRISPQDDVASVKWVGEDELAVVPWSSKIHFANALHVLQKIAISA